MKEQFQKLEQLKFDINLLQLEREQASKILILAKQKNEAIQSSMNNARSAMQASGGQMANQKNKRKSIDAIHQKYTK